MGRADEARLLLKESVVAGRRSLGKARTPDAKWNLGWHVALAHARLGEKQLAREAIAAAGPPPESAPTSLILSVEIPALSALEDWEPIADLLRKQDDVKDAVFRYDPCSRPELAPMRADPRYSEWFSRCKPLERSS
jgi:hypothetical protein